MKENGETSSQNKKAIQKATVFEIQVASHSGRADIKQTEEEGHPQQSEAITEIQLEKASGGINTVFGIEDLKTCQNEEEFHGDVEQQKTEAEKFQSLSKTENQPDRKITPASVLQRILQTEDSQDSFCRASNPMISDGDGVKSQTRKMNFLISRHSLLQNPQPSKDTFSVSTSELLHRSRTNSQRREIFVSNNQQQNLRIELDQALCQLRKLQKENALLSQELTQTKQMLREREHGANIGCSLIVDQSPEFRLLMEKHRDLVARMEERDSQNHELRRQLESAQQDICSHGNELQAKCQTVDNLRSIIRN